MDLKSVLVLGGNGYLGSKVVRRLVEEGCSVVCTKRNSSDLTRLSDVYDKIKFIPASAESILTALQYTQLDVVLNMACNYGRSDVLYGNVIESNIEFPLKVLNIAVENGIRRYVTIGTGLPDQFNMYSFSKSMLNGFGKFYAEKHGIDFFVARLEMFYGKDEPEDRFLPSVIRNMCLGQDVNTTLGSQKRDIIAVEDVVEAIIMILKFQGGGYKEIPVGTGIAPLIFEVIDFIWEETGKKSRLNKGAIPMRKNEPDCVADTTLLQSICEWHPIFWKDGIRQMIKDKMNDCVL